MNAKLVFYPARDIVIQCVPKGPIPTEFGGLINLRDLHINRNTLSGSSCSPPMNGKLVFHPMRVIF